MFGEWNSIIWKRQSVNSVIITYNMYFFIFSYTNFPPAYQEPGYKANCISGMQAEAMLPVATHLSNTCEDLSMNNQRNTFLC